MPRPQHSPCKASCTSIFYLQTAVAEVSLLVATLQTCFAHSHSASFVAQLLRQGLVSANEYFRAPFLNVLVQTQNLPALYYFLELLIALDLQVCI